MRIGGVQFQFGRELDAKGMSNRVNGKIRAKGRAWAKSRT